MSDIITKTKTFLAKKFHLLYYFYKQLGINLFITLLLNCLMVIMDGLGIALFIPLLKVADNPNSATDNDKLLQYIRAFFSHLGLPLTVLNVVLFIILIFIFKALFYYFTNIFQWNTINRFTKDLRLRNVQGLKNLNYFNFVKADFGHFQNTLSGEAYKVESSAISYIETLKNIIIVVVYLILSLMMDYKFSIMVIFAGIISNFLYSIFYNKTKRQSALITDSSHQLSSDTMQSLTNFKYLKATNAINAYSERWKKTINDIYRHSVTMTKITSSLQSLREPLLIIVVCIVILIQVLIFKTNVSSIIIVLLFFYRSMTYLISLQSVWNSFLTTSGSLENMMNFERFLKNHQEPHSGIKIIDKIEGIVLQNVCLSFDDFQVLKQIDFKIEGKETIALVGESGSGKSTLANMLCGLYRPEQGTFKVNSETIDSVDLASFRSRIGYISQEPTIFTGSIFENVSLWQTKTKENVDRFWEAVNKSNLLKFITELPEKEETILGNNGINLSGGQKQRISIARELYKDIDMLIMDEATSALDSETEREVQESIDRLEGELIIIIIAHRLATVLNADRVVLMNKGIIENQGVFDELKQKSEYFNKLASLQGL